MIIYIINSARDSLAGHIRRDLALQRHVLLICDECHHYTSKENRKIFGFLEGAHASALREKELYLCLGLSATPFGTSNDEVLFRSLGREIYQYGFDSAVNEGIISPFTVCEVSSSFYADELAEYGELTFRIGKALIALLRAHPQLKKLRERKEKSFIRAVMRIAKEADMDPEEPACTYLMLTWQRKEISTLARATILVTSIPRLEATIKPRSTYMAVLAREVMRLWAAFSSLVFSKETFRILSAMRIARIPAASKIKARQSVLSRG